MRIRFGRSPSEIKRKAVNGESAVDTNDSSVTEPSLRIIASPACRHGMPGTNPEPQR
jgi:hypothetical protein